MDKEERRSMAREQEPMENLKKYRKSGLEHFIKFVRELPSPSPQATLTTASSPARDRTEARSGP